MNIISAYSQYNIRRNLPSRTGTAVLKSGKAEERMDGRPTSLVSSP